MDVVLDGPASRSRAKVMVGAGSGAGEPNTDRRGLAQAEVHGDDRAGSDAALSAGVHDWPRGAGRLHDRRLACAEGNDAAVAAMGGAARPALLHRTGPVSSRPLGRRADQDAAEVRVL